MERIEEILLFKCNMDVKTAVRVDKVRCGEHTIWEVVVIRDNQPRLSRAWYTYIEARRDFYNTVKDML